MVKHTQIIHQQKLTNCLSVFDHFVGLAVKELRKTGCQFQHINLSFIYFSIYLYVKSTNLSTVAAPFLLLVSHII